jgi:hypothetical protein
LRVSEKSERQQQQMRWFSFRHGIGGVRENIIFEDWIWVLEKEIENRWCGVMSFKQVSQIPRQAQTR